jgi:hypothetical protein
VGGQQEILHRGQLVFDAFSGFNTLVKGVLDFRHLGHEVGYLDKRRRGAATGENKLDMGRFIFNELEDFLRRDKAEETGAIDFVEDHEVVLAAGNILPGGGEGGLCLDFFGRINGPFISDELAQAEAGYLDVGQGSERFKFALGGTTLDEENNRYFQSVTGRPENRAQRGGRFTLAIAGENLDKASGGFFSQGRSFLP